MATPLYARYIPPSKSSPSTEASSASSPQISGKKRKRQILSKEADGLVAAGVSLERDNRGAVENEKKRADSNAATKAVVVDSHDISHKSHKKTRKDERRQKSKHNEGQTDLTPERSSAIEDAYKIQDEPLIHDRTPQSATNRKKRKQVKAEHELATEETKHQSTSDTPLKARTPETPMEVDKKYQSVVSKFERSKKVAEKLTKRDISTQPSTELQEEDQARAELQGLVPLPQPAQVADPEALPLFSALPHWLSEPITVSSKDTISFKSLQISPKLASSLESRGYREAFAVQAAVLPLLLPGHNQQSGDVCVSAATGSGKTLAYVLPMVEDLRVNVIRKLRGLIVVPTRELVTQACDVCDLIAAGSGLQIGTAVGSRHLRAEQELLIKKGQKYDPEGYRNIQSASEDWRSKGRYDDRDLSVEEGLDILPDHVVEYSSKVDILICTPGRLVDHMRSSKGFTLNHVSWLIIDEADRLLNQSFQGWLDLVMTAIEGERPRNQLSKREQILLDMEYPTEKRPLRKVVLSATMTKDIQKLSGLKLRKPKLVVVDNVGNVSAENEARTGAMTAIETYDLPTTLTEHAIAVGDSSEKPLYLLQLLRIILEQEDATGSEPPHNADDSDETSSSGSSDSSVSGDDETSSDESVVSSDSSDSSGTSSSGSSSSNSSNNLFSARKDSVQKSDGSRASHGVLIFTNNNENATRLSFLLAKLHPSFAPITASLTKSSATSEGRKVLRAFRSGKLSILVASDRASRGLDLPSLGHIINYDISTSVTAYVHRVGRTARAGHDGQAWTFYSHSEARWFWNDIAKGQQIRRKEDQKVERFKLDPKAIDQEGRRRYEEALKALQDEVRGTH
ncbi:MAG: hypothetical protein M1819_006216 [Sarea resinae]|nr:MAG: hypothetical protein M1819_006216 [Sarea resinae]